MWGNRFAFLACCAIGAACCGAFFFFAPRIEVIQARARTEPPRRPLRVHLRPDSLPAPRAAEEVPVSRPGEVGDLLHGAPTTIALPPHSDSAASAAWNNVRRIARAEVARDFDLAVSDDIVEDVDIAVAQTAMREWREGIQVARRLVRAENGRVLEEGAAPELQVPRTPGGNAPLPAVVAPPNLLAEAARAPALRPPASTASPHAVISEALDTDIALFAPRSVAAALRQERRWSLIDAPFDARLDAGSSDVTPLAPAETGK